MIDLAKLSDQELLALKAGDYSKLSDKTLLSLKEQQPSPEPQPEASKRAPGMKTGILSQVSNTLKTANPILGTGAVLSGMKPEQRNMALETVGFAAGEGVGGPVGAGIGTMIGRGGADLLNTLDEDPSKVTKALQMGAAVAMNPTNAFNISKDDLKQGLSTAADYTQTGSEAAIMSGMFKGAHELTKKAAPYIISKFAKITPDQVKTAISDPKFFAKYKGTVQAVDTKIKEISDTITTAKKSIAKRMYGAKQYLGLTDTPVEYTSVDQIQAAFKKAVSSPGKGAVTETLKEPLTGDLLKQTFSPRKPNPEALRNELINLNTSLNRLEQAKFSPAAAKLKGQIVSKIESLPSGKYMRGLSEKYSETEAALSQLGKNLQNPQIAPKLIDKMIKGDLKGVLSESGIKKSSAIREILKHSKKDPFRELKNEATAKELNQLVSPLVKDRLGMGLGLVGLVAHPSLQTLAAEGAMVAGTSPKLLSRLGQTLMNPPAGGSVGQGALLAAFENWRRRRSK